MKEYVDLIKTLGFDIRQRSYVLYFYDNKQDRLSCYTHQPKHANELFRAIARHLKPLRKIHSHHSLELQLKQNSIAVKGFPYTDVLAIDLDFHDDPRAQDESLDEFILYFNKLFNVSEPLYAEKSKLGKGAHLFYRLNCRISDALISQVSRYVSDELKRSVEFRTSEKALRLPLSKDYELIADNSGSLECGSIDTIRSEFYVEQAANQIEVFQRSNSSQAYRNFYVHCKDNYAITAGNRVGGEQLAIKMGFAAIHHGVGFGDYLEALIGCNVSSKDLTNWSRREIEEDAQKIYDWCKEKYSEEDYGKVKRIQAHGFCSNLDLLSPSMKRWAKLIAKRYVIPSLNRKKMKEVTELLLMEMIGYQLFNQSSTRKFHDKAEITALMKKKILEGSYFSPKWLALFKDHYEITYIDLRKVLKACISILTSLDCLKRTTNWSNFERRAFGIHHQFDLLRLEGLARMARTARTARTGKAFLENFIQHIGKIDYYVINLINHLSEKIYGPRELYYPP